MKKSWKKLSPRRDGHEPPPPDVIPKIPSKKWKEKYECKKNKGSHIPEIVSICSHGWTQRKDGEWYTYWGAPSIKVTWECTACKKRLYEYRCPEKKFDKYRGIFNG